jgi:RimJ/RimL family protein N-acetyltransferase
VREVSIESGTAYTALIENKIGDEERIAHIRIFTPFQDSKNIGELEGKGIGTAVLSMLLKEFESEGVVGASYHTKDERMQHVLEKVGFQKIGEYVYFKRFES